MNKNTKNRVGETNINKQGLLMTIIRYENNRNMDIIFDNDNQVVEGVSYEYFKNGSIPNYNIPSYLGKGYRGYGIYKTRVNNIKTEEYIKWGSMLTRCYSEKLRQRINYTGCSVCDEWLNFQNFAEWYNRNIYNMPFNEKLELDKDIKYKGNKIYSPSTCLLVPKKLNSIILNRHNNRGSSFIGVYYRRADNKYLAQVNDGSGKNIFLGVFNTEHDAFDAYSNAKLKIISEIANTYKFYIPKNVYNAIINYKIEITD